MLKFNIIKSNTAVDLKSDLNTSYVKVQFFC